jgi:hypothetical protein
MRFFRLSALEGSEFETYLEALDSYLYRLTSYAKQNITATKVSRELNIDTNTAMRLLLKCVDLNVVKITYCIVCPECGTHLQRFNEISAFTESETCCYNCDYTFTIESKNVEVLFELVDSPVFHEGQQACCESACQLVALEDTLHALLTSKAGYNLLYKPTEEDYENLLKEIENVTMPAKNTKEKGDTLESLTQHLFSLCKGFRCANIKTSTNQIDVFGRNLVLPYCVFGRLGERFVIECKNENDTPSGEYMRKVQSIISEINANGRIIGVGIIVSRFPGPKTFKTIANKHYLISGILLINITLEEISLLVTNKRNLLELIERKMDDIVIDATSDLVQAGIFDT